MRYPEDQIRDDTNSRQGSSVAQLTSSSSGPPVGQKSKNLTKDVKKTRERNGNNDESCPNDVHRGDAEDNEDQLETSKRVLQLVTDSCFNMTQINGQRKLGGPPPGWDGPPPGPGCEVFVGKIPRTLYEHEIYPVFRRMGEVYEIRLMMDFSGTNRGYCFVMFGQPEYAQRAIRELNNFEIRPGRRIGVVASINNCRLYVGQLPPEIPSKTVIKKICEITDDVSLVAIYRNAHGHARYALISYKTHRGAAMARRRLVPDRATLFRGAEVSIDWAHPSMFPSNVVEESGICDEDGNVEILRSVVGNDTKRNQSRRRACDQFLEHSICTYLQIEQNQEQMGRIRTSRSHQRKNKDREHSMSIREYSYPSSNSSGFNGDDNDASSVNTQPGQGGRVSFSVAVDPEDEIRLHPGPSKHQTRGQGSCNVGGNSTIPNIKDVNDWCDRRTGTCSSESGCSTNSSISGKRRISANQNFGSSSALSDSEARSSRLDGDEDSICHEQLRIIGQCPSSPNSRIMQSAYSDADNYSSSGSSEKTTLDVENVRANVESLNLFDNYTFLSDGRNSVTDTNGNCIEVAMDLSSTSVTKLVAQPNPNRSFHPANKWNPTSGGRSRFPKNGVEFVVSQKAIATAQFQHELRNAHLMNNGNFIPPNKFNPNTDDSYPRFTDKITPRDVDFILESQIRAVNNRELLLAKYPKVHEQRTNRPIYSPRNSIVPNEFVNNGLISNDSPGVESSRLSDYFRGSNFLRSQNATHSAPADHDPVLPESYLNFQTSGNLTNGRIFDSLNSANPIPMPNGNSKDVENPDILTLMNNSYPLSHANSASCARNRNDIFDENAPSYAPLVYPPYRKDLAIARNISGVDLARNYPYVARQSHEYANHSLEFPQRIGENLPPNDARHLFGVQTDLSASAIYVKNNQRLAHPHFHQQYNGKPDASFSVYSFNEEQSHLRSSAAIFVPRDHFPVMNSSAAYNLRAGDHDNHNQIHLTDEDRNYLCKNGKPKAGRPILSRAQSTNFRDN